jgi:hypothetical protein
LDGVTYSTVEHAYQAAKTEKRSERQEIWAAETAGQAKRLGKKVTMRGAWPCVREGIMFALLWQKFNQEPFRTNLLEYEGRIIEWNTWHDKFWGRRTCRRCKGEGKNVLGRLLQEIKDRLRRE